MMTTTTLMMMVDDDGLGAGRKLDNLELLKIFSRLSL